MLVQVMLGRLFVVAVATDLADGRVARRRGEVTPLGGFADHAVDADARLYDRLFTVENPMGETDDDGNARDFIEFLNPEALTVLTEEGT